MTSLIASLFAEKAVVPIVGLALCHSWILSPFLSNAIFYASFHTGFAIALLACAALYYTRPSGTAAFRTMPWVSAIAMTTSTAVTVLTIGQPGGAVHVVSGMLGGMGSAYCFARWFMSYGSFTMKTAVGSTLLAFALSGCIRFVLVLLQNTVPTTLNAILIVLPLIDAFLLSRAPNPDQGSVYASPLQTERAEKSGASLARTGRKPFIESIGGDIPAITLEVVVYGLVFGLLRDGINEWSTSAPSMLIGHGLRIVVPALMFWWLALRTRGKAEAPALKLTVLLVAFAVLAVLFFGGLGEAVLSAVVLAARSLVSILIYIRAFEAMHRAKLHPMIAYGVGRGFYELSLVAGLFVYQTAVESGLAAMLSFDTFYFFVSCVLLLLLNGFSGAIHLPFLQSAPVPAATAFDDACANIAATHNLTEREAEVMRLICKGHTKKRIAEILCVSEDTIRYHSKNLYQKLGIHSRQELLDLVG